MLASIQTIKMIRTADNSDNLDVVSVLGWEVVNKRGELAPGDTVVYVEIDTVLPERPEFEFMRSKGFRVKTIRLRGNLSQGIVFPLSILPDGEWTVGTEVGDVLGITHYEKPIPVQMQGMMRSGCLPFGIPKTDEPRIENFPEIVDALQGEQVYITTKVDGTSATYSMKDGDFWVSGRKVSYKDDVENVYWKMAKKYKLAEKLQGFNVAVQGEIAGPGIQGNKMCLKDHELFVFNVIDLDNGKFFDYTKLRAFCRAMCLTTVPLEYVGVFDFTMDDIKTWSVGLYEGTKNLKEGIVIRALNVNEYSQVIKGKKSFKVVNPTYLLKNKE